MTQDLTPVPAVQKGHGVDAGMLMVRQRGLNEGRDRFRRLPRAFELVARTVP